MSLTNGPGGFFIYSNEPKKLAVWYEEILGFKFEGDKTNNFYQVFMGLDVKDSNKKLDTHFAIMKTLKDSKKEFESDKIYGDQFFMLNVRTDDIDNLKIHIKEKGIHIIKEEEYEYGKFAWIMDPDNNRIELYQPLTFNQ